MKKGERSNSKNLIQSDKKRKSQTFFAEVLNGDLEAVKALVEEQGVDPREALKEGNNMGATPIVVAALKGHLEVVKYLVEEQGVDPREALKEGNNMGVTPIVMAAAKGHLKVVEYLVGQGNVDPRAALGKGKFVGATLMHMAMRYGHLELVIYLMSLEINPMIYFKIAKENNQVAIINFIKKTEFSQEKLNELLLAQINGDKPNIDRIRVLIENGADVNARDIKDVNFEDGGDTALHKAACWGHTDVVKLLLKAEADVKAKDDWSRTALHLAARNGHIDVVTLLIGNGADVAAIGFSGGTALHHAVNRGNLEMAKLLFDAGAKLDAVDSYGFTVLHKAATRGHTDVAKFLLEKEADVNAENVWGGTALHSAAEEAHSEVMELLLEKGADVNATGNCGLTALHMAANHNGDRAVNEVLFKAGAKVNAKTKNGDTALHLAADNMHLGLAQHLAIIELLEKGFTGGESIPDSRLSTTGHDNLYIQALGEYNLPNNAGSALKKEIDDLMTERKLNQAVLDVEQGKTKLLGSIDTSDKKVVRERLIERLKNNKKMRVKLWDHLSMGNEFISPTEGNKEGSEKITSALLLFKTGIYGINDTKTLSGKCGNALRCVSPNLSGQIKPPKDVLSDLPLESLVSAYVLPGVSF
jgi:ankyrin repeat protein